MSVRHSRDELIRRPSRSLFRDEAVKSAAGEVEKRSKVLILTAIMEWNNIEKARLHLADPKLKEMLQNAGVTGLPEVRFFNHA